MILTKKGRHELNDRIVHFPFTYTKIDPKDLQKMESSSELRINEYWAMRNRKKALKEIQVKIM